MIVILSLIHGEFDDKISGALAWVLGLPLI